jgi:hypothetical protein
MRRVRNHMLPDECGWPGTAWRGEVFWAVAPPRIRSLFVWVL